MLAAVFLTEVFYTKFENIVERRQRDVDFSRRIT